MKHIKNPDEIEEE